MTMWAIVFAATPFEQCARSDVKIYANKKAHEVRHQADNLAKLRQDFLSLPDLIAQILCAVAM